MAEPTARPPMQFDKCPTGTDPIQYAIAWREYAWAVERQCKSLEALLQQAVDALAPAIPCLEDWMRTTGFGQTHERDKAARDAIRTVLAAAAEVNIVPGKES